MSDLSDYAEEKLAQHLVGLTNWSPPGTVYLALFDGDPGESGALNEVTASEYVRQIVTFQQVGASPSDTVSNLSRIEFPQATSDWGVIDYAGIFDARTGGNQLASTQLTASRDIDDGDIAIVDPGQFSVVLA